MLVSNAIDRVVHFLFLVQQRRHYRSIWPLTAWPEPSLQIAIVLLMDRWGLADLPCQLSVHMEEKQPQCCYLSINE